MLDVVRGAAQPWDQEATHLQSALPPTLARPGGCCASRAGFVGALAGALTAGPAAPQLPTEWVEKMPGYQQLAAAAERLAALRD